MLSMKAKILDWGAICNSVGTSDLLHFHVQEYLKIENVGTVIVLSDDRGFTLSPVISTNPDEEPIQTITVNEIERNVRNCVLPDEPAVEDHPYEELARIACKKGFEVTADMLRSIPYEIKISEELKNKILDH